ncbi:peptidyl-prolyl cis-trans isomerase FKBP19, chloroplastic-like, partial [Morus notabilis]|uniref:peptidyl-prolyl cis-trans isomerase FKBP19, chloroplastic-like n=1 Tax=Morus notabilis TaxID=981085 RepID=UPI000CED4D9E
VDWDGYTIGYYGRIFEARNKTKGGSFEGDDKDFFKFRVGSQEVIPAFEEAVSSMALGGIRRCVASPIYQPCVIKELFQKVSKTTTRQRHS